jgi:hypothetical protein
VDCHHCGEPINVDAIDYYSMSQCVSGCIIASLHFHRSCFEEVAGEDYMKNLEIDIPPDRTEEAFNVNNQNQDQFIPTTVSPYKRAKHNPCYICHKKIPENSPVNRLDNTSGNICITCWDSMFKGGPK